MGNALSGDASSCTDGLVARVCTCFLGTWCTAVLLFGKVDFDFVYFEVPRLY